MTSADASKHPADDENGSYPSNAFARVNKEAKDVAAAGLERAGDDEIAAIQQRWENRLAWPVLVAAILSVPAVFLTLLDGPFEIAGHIALYLTTAVLVFETTVFFLISPKKIEWVRRNWWLLGLTIVTILAVIFSIGPMQFFRTVRSVGALRVLRAKQVAKAGESLAKRGESRWRRLFGQVLATLVVGTFVVLALAVPESEARSTLEHYVGQDGVPWAAAVAGVLTVVIMYFLVRTPRTHHNKSGPNQSSAVPKGS